MRACFSCLPFAVCALLPAACGSRTPLDRDGDAGEAADSAPAGVEAGPDVALDTAIDVEPAPDVAPSGCPGSVPAAPAGQMLWQTTLTADRFLVGPMAADDAGDTYYVDDGFLVGGVVPGGSRILSLDPCGNVRWTAAWDHFASGSVAAYLMVSNSRLIASDGDVEAFDLATGAHLWTVDVAGFGAISGIGDLTGSGAMGSPAATADGTVYLELNAPGQSWLAKIDPSGHPHPIGRIPGASRGGFATDLIVDSLGRLDVAVAFSNTSPGPGAVEAFDRGGALLFMSQLVSVGYQDHLMSGDTFLLSEDSASLLGLDGGLTAMLSPTMAQPAVVDPQGALYAIRDVSSAGLTAQAWNADLSKRWTAVLAGNTFYEYTGGPLLGAVSNVYFLAQIDEGSSVTTTVSAVDQQSGNQTGWSFPDQSPGYMLLVAPGELVFTMGGRAVAISSGGEGPAASRWPTPRGGNDQRAAARGR